MKYLKKFNTHTEYEEQKDSIQGPNVVYCEAENEVHYNKPSAWMIGKYNVTSTTSPTVITSGYIGPDVIKAFEIGIRISIIQILLLINLKFMVYLKIYMKNIIII